MTDTGASTSQITTHTRQRFTEDDLLRLGPDVWAEVIDGAVIITWPEPDTGEEPASRGPVGFLHGLIAANVYDALKPYARDHRLGYVLGDGVIYILSTDQTCIRGALVPDVSFVRQGRCPPDFDLTRPFPGPPDLVVEIISPSEADDDVLAQVDMYLDAGTAQVWVLYPSRGEVYQYTRRDGKTAAHIHHGTDRLDPGDLFPGLDLSAETLFTLPEALEA